MTRPTEIAGLTSRQFIAYYWLKAELVAYCRANNLPTAGAKRDLTDRIETYLATGEIVQPKPTRRRKSGKATMPDTFTRATLIGDGWRCSQELRAFFETEIGQTFHFNKFMRDFIKQDGVGQPLQAAIDGWLASKQLPQGASEIAPQFEYNRHIRDYFKQHKNATRADAIAAWNAKKAQKNN